MLDCCFCNWSCCLWRTAPNSQISQGNRSLFGKPLIPGAVLSVEIVRNMLWKGWLIVVSVIEAVSLTNSRKLFPQWRENKNTPLWKTYGCSTCSEFWNSCEYTWERTIDFCFCSWSCFLDELPQTFSRIKSSRENKNASPLESLWVQDLVWVLK